MDVSQVTRLASASLGVALALGGCGSNSTTDLDTAEPADGPEWLSTVLVGDRTGPGRVLLLGQHRLDDERTGYESSGRSLMVGPDGEVVEVAPPPLQWGLTGGDGAMIGDAAYVMATDCPAGGDPYSGGFGCVAEDSTVRFLRYDLAEDVWTEIPLPDHLEANQRAHLTLIDGQSREGGPIYFGVPSPPVPSLTVRIVAFDPVGNEWHDIDAGEPSLGSACTDGESVYYLDAEALVTALTEVGEDGPAASAATDIEVSLLVAQPGAAHREDIVLPYPTARGTDPLDALGVIPHCLGVGQVLISTGVSDPDSGVPWVQRSDDGRWRQVELPEDLAQPGPWTAQVLEGSAVFFLEQGPDEATPRYAVVYRAEEGSWERLPDLSPSIVPHAAAPLGADRIITFHPAGMTPSTLEVIEVP